MLFSSTEADVSEVDQGTPRLPEDFHVSLLKILLVYTDRIDPNMPRFNCAQGSEGRLAVRRNRQDASVTDDVPLI